MPAALIIFVRNPEAGKVKTRIAHASSPAFALRVYEKLLQHTREIANAVSCIKYLFYTDSANTKDAWPNNVYKKYVQYEGDLGERMKHAFQTVFVNGHSHAVIIGSDCPGLQPTHIKEAIDALDTHDIVIGPSTDGGYYLLGMKQVHEQLFRNKSWSTADVLTQTLSDLQTLNLSCHLLEALTDVDEVKDIPQNWFETL